MFMEMWRISNYCMVSYKYYNYSIIYEKKNIVEEEEEEYEM